MTTVEREILRIEREIIEEGRELGLKQGQKLGRELGLKQGLKQGQKLGLTHRVDRCPPTGSRTRRSHHGADRGHLYG